MLKEGWWPCGSGAWAEIRLGTDCPVAKFKATVEVVKMGRI